MLLTEHGTANTESGNVRLNDEGRLLLERLLELPMLPRGVAFFNVHDDLYQGEALTTSTLTASDKGLDFSPKALGSHSDVLLFHGSDGTTMLGEAASGARDIALRYYRRHKLVLDELGLGIFAKPKYWPKQIGIEAYHTLENGNRRIVGRNSKLAQNELNTNQIGRLAIFRVRFKSLEMLLGCPGGSGCVQDQPTLEMLLGCPGGSGCVQDQPTLEMLLGCPGGSGCVQDQPTLEMLLGCPGGSGCVQDQPTLEMLLGCPGGSGCVQDQPTLEMLLGCPGGSGCVQDQPALEMLLGCPGGSGCVQDQPALEMLLGCPGGSGCVLGKENAQNAHLN